MTERKAESPSTIRRGRLSGSEDSEIEELFLSGMRTREIARQLNRHASTIHFALTRLGLKAPKPRTFSYERRGRPVRSFSSEEDAFIEALRIQNYAITKIADLCSKRFGYRRTAATIRVRLIMLANRDDGTEAGA